MHCIPCGRTDAGKLLCGGKRLCTGGRKSGRVKRLGAAPTDDTQPLELRPKQHARAKREIILGPLDAARGEPNSKVQPKDSWEQQQAADQADEARLKRKLVICRTCLIGESARDDATSSVSR